MATLSGGRGWASDACAASVHRLDSAFGRILPINSAGRTYAEQAEAYRKYKNGGPLALPPGTSIHERGNAIDWHNSVWGILGLNAGLGWRGQPINRHGHRRTVSSETWHTEYEEGEDNFRGQGGGGFNQDVKNRQGWLNESRGESLDVDGVFGPATEAAIKRYQEFLRDNYGYGGAIDGDWGQGTQDAHQKYWDARRAGTAVGQSPYTQYGGADWIRAIQQKLNRLNYGPLAEDGEDGPATRAAVTRFQNDNGLGADGIAGPITNNKMDALLTAAPVGRNATSRSTTEIQNYLKSKGYDLGQYGADGDYGQATTQAVMKWQKDNGLEPDGIWGPLADAKAFPPENVGGNRTKRSTWDIQRLVGANADGVWGPETTDKVKAWQAANGLEADGIWGEASDAKGFPTTNPVSNFPTNGRNATTRKTEDIQRLVGATVDGSYGPNTSVHVAMWQKDNGLDADGVWGPASDAKGFPGIPLPDAPADPGADPTYGKKTPTYPGAAWADISPNKSVREGKVQGLGLHHRADTGNAASARKRFMSANDRNVSPNWNVNQDGSADEIVPPDDYRAWTSGQIDHQLVTIETGNTSAEPYWGISKESHERIADILAWASNRYGFPIQLGAAELRDGKNVITRPGLIPHRDMPSGKQTGTICPGPSMNLDWIITRAKEIFQVKYVETTPGTPQEPGTPTIPAGMTLVPTEFLKNLQANAQADADEIGKFLD